MARTFSTDIANYLDFGLAGIGPLVNGAAKISISARVNRTGSFSTAGVNDNRILSVIINGVNTTGFTLCVDANTSVGNGKLRAGGRSVSTDGFQAVNGATTLAQDGSTSYVVGGLLDISGDTIKVYLNGAEDGSGAVTFGNAAYTQGTPSSSVDQLSSSASTALSWVGQISEVAIWAADIGAANFAKLGLKLDPRSVDFDNLVFYCPVMGNDDPEPELISRVSGTVRGSLPKADHPAVIRRGSTRVAHSAVAAPPAGGGGGGMLLLGVG